MNARQRIILALVAVVLAMFALAACAPSGVNQEGEIQIVHDAKYRVTCWVYSTNAYKGGISCIPDFQLFRNDNGNFDPQDWYDEWPELLEPSSATGHSQVLAVFAPSTVKRPPWPHDKAWCKYAPHIDGSKLIECRRYGGYRR